MSDEAWMDSLGKLDYRIVFETEDKEEYFAGLRKAINDAFAVAMSATDDNPRLIPTIKKRRFRDLISVLYARSYQSKAAGGPGTWLHPMPKDSNFNERLQGLFNASSQNGTDRWQAEAITRKVEVSGGTLNIVAYIEVLFANLMEAFPGAAAADVKAGSGSATNASAIKGLLPRTDSDESTGKISEEVREEVLAALSAAAILATAREELEVAVETAETELERLRGENATLQKAEADRNQEIVVLRQAHDGSIAALKSEKDVLEEQVKQITAEADQARDANEELARTYKKATEEQAASAMSAFNAVSEKAKSDLVQVRAELSAKEREISELSESSRQGQLQLQGELAKVNALQAENATELASVAAELEGIRKSLLETEEKLRLSAEVNDSLRADAAQQDTALQAAERAASGLRTQLDEAAETHKADLRAREDSFETLRKTIAAIYKLRDHLIGPMKARNKVLYEIFDLSNPAYPDIPARIKAGKDAVAKFDNALTDEQAQKILDEVRPIPAGEGGGNSAKKGVDLAPRWAPLRF